MPWLGLRVAADPRLPTPAFKVRITDARGQQSTLTPQGGDAMTALPQGPDLTKIWAEEVLVDPAPALDDGLDLSRITRVELVSTSHSAGSGSRTSPPYLPASPRSPIAGSPR